jgi:hypothetical protein
MNVFRTRPIVFECGIHACIKFDFNVIVKQQIAKLIISEMNRKVVKDMKMMHFLLVRKY